MVKTLKGSKGPEAKESKERVLFAMEYGAQHAGWHCMEILNRAVLSAILIITHWHNTNGLMRALQHAVALDPKP